LGMSRRRGRRKKKAVGIENTKAPAHKFGDPICSSSRPGQRDASAKESGDCWDRKNRRTTGIEGKNRVNPENSLKKVKRWNWSSG